MSKWKRFLQGVSRIRHFTSGERKTPENAALGYGYFQQWFTKTPLPASRSWWRQSPAIGLIKTAFFFLTLIIYSLAAWVESTGRPRLCRKHFLRKSVLLFLCVWEYVALTHPPLVWGRFEHCGIPGTPWPDMLKSALIAETLLHVHPNQRHVSNWGEGEK